MDIWIQSLSWTLIYALGQGFVVYASLWSVLKLLPSASASVKYHLSLSALTILLTWFVATWWQHSHSLRSASASLSETMRAIHDSSVWYHSALSTLIALLPWLSAFYISGVILMLVRLSLGMVQVFSFRKHGLSQSTIALEAIFISLKKKLNYGGPARLFISAKAHVPMVVGFIKPMILLPAATLAQLSPEQLETIILHELAHIRRYDYLVNILQTVVEIILFFNPFVWMISRIIRRERELCCDDLVLGHTKEPIFYASALSVLATNATKNSALTIAAAGQPHDLLNRIKRIMEMKKNPFSYSRMIAAIVVVAVFSCTIAWMTPTFVQYEMEQAEAADMLRPTPIMLKDEMSIKALPYQDWRMTYPVSNPRKWTPPSVDPLPANPNGEGC